jgi:hypothetical protein
MWQKLVVLYRYKTLQVLPARMLVYKIIAFDTVKRHRDNIVSDIREQRQSELATRDTTVFRKPNKDQRLKLSGKTSGR